MAHVTLSYVCDEPCLPLKGEVCGLCGDFDGDGQNDFTTQGQLAVSSVLEFANSWKVSSACPDAEPNANSCELRPSRQQWSKVMCSIILGDTFKECHTKVKMLSSDILFLHLLKYSLNIYNTSNVYFF